MATLATLYLKKETIDILKATSEKKGLKGVEITISISDETNDFGQNVSSFVSQTEQERKEKKKRFYVGNGSVFWTDGKISVAKKNKQDVVEQEKNEDGLPF
jgi:hypothetical protein